MMKFSLRLLLMLALAQQGCGVVNAASAYRINRLAERVVCEGEPGCRPPGTPACVNGKCVGLK